MLLRGIDREDVRAGPGAGQAGSITPHTKFEAEVYILRKDEGGRHTPFFDGYRPQFYIRTMDVTGTVHMQEGTEMVMPGDNVNLNVELIIAGRAGDGKPLRHPRGRPHCGRRRHHEGRRSSVGRVRLKRPRSDLGAVSANELMDRGGPLWPRKLLEWSSRSSAPSAASGTTCRRKIGATTRAGLS